MTFLSWSMMSRRSCWSSASGPAGVRGPESDRAGTSITGSASANLGVRVRDIQLKEFRQGVFCGLPYE